MSIKLYEMHVLILMLNFKNKFANKYIIYIVNNLTRNNLAEFNLISSMCYFCFLSYIEGHLNYIISKQTVLTI